MNMEDIQSILTSYPFKSTYSNKFSNLQVELLLQRSDPVLIRTLLHGSLVDLFVLFLDEVLDT